MHYYVSIFAGGPYVLHGKQCIVVGFDGAGEAKDYARENNGELLKRTAHVTFGENQLCVKNVAIGKDQVQDVLSNLSTLGITTSLKPTIRRGR